ncbi:hypothetical protein HNQ59_002427 [Chitinivorax tropicus]|uniref:Uncharacterized protein n=1 Tax=Chitinivorax tropicus TaxID=714531 RepID=A0A840MPW4_9PROT|nr:hypothetical protein [Chitinivorax tropicus]MBB5019129.1 hypothetical protein [Chitinivorax tropicus]
MNQFVRHEYSESTHRLALGVETWDAARQQPVLTPLWVGFDDVLLGHVRPLFDLHPSNRYALRYDSWLASQARQIDIRLMDAMDERVSIERSGRRYVPRRLRITVPTLAAAESNPPSGRGCQPWLYPGATYPLSQTATGLRARVMRAAAGPLPRRPARWVRVVATLPAGSAIADVAELNALPSARVVGRAMGDDRGEFLLLVPPAAAQAGTAASMPVRLIVLARVEQAVPADRPDLPTIDPCWDLPVETPASLAVTDAVLRGETTTAGFAIVAQREISLPLGRLLRGVADIEI